MKFDSNSLLSICLLIVLALYLAVMMGCSDSSGTIARVETPKIVMAVEDEPTFFDVPLSEEVQNHIFTVCDSYGIDSALVIAIIERESNFTIDSVGDEGRSFGLMQINKQWHEKRMEELGVTDLFDPCQNITVGVNYLAELREQGNNLHWLLMAYNGGASYADEMMTQGLVSDYALEVLMRSKEV